MTETAWNLLSNCCLLLSWDLPWSIDCSVDSGRCMVRLALPTIQEELVLVQVEVDDVFFFCIHCYPLWFVIESISFSFFGATLEGGLIDEYIYRAITAWGRRCQDSKCSFFFSFWCFLVTFLFLHIFQIFSYLLFVFPHIFDDQSQIFSPHGLHSGGVAKQLLEVHREEPSPTRPDQGGGRIEMGRFLYDVNMFFNF